MTDKQLRKLKRVELLELMIEQGKEIEELKEDIARLEQELADRNILIEEAGSIAEAALKLNKVFEAAQEAADQYLENIRNRAGAQDEAPEAPAEDQQPTGEEETTNEG